jgi:hypothetical protein
MRVCAGYIRKADAVDLERANELIERGKVFVAQQQRRVGLLAANESMARRFPRELEVALSIDRLRKFFASQ